jgi:hypothetical protein
MMRCCCCNTNLNDYESTLRSVATGDYLDMCKRCLQDLNIETLANANEPNEPSPDDEYFWDFPETEFHPVIDDE